MKSAKAASNQAVRTFLRRCSGVISSVVMVTLVKRIIVGAAPIAKRVGPVSDAGSGAASTASRRHHLAIWGAVVQLWNGGGEGSSHSRPLAPSQTLPRPAYRRGWS